MINELFPFQQNAVSALRQKTSDASKSFARFARREVSSGSSAWISPRARSARRCLKRVTMMTCARCLICMDSRKGLKTFHDSKKENVDN